MAEDDPRVHKASEVHKRRAPKKVRPKDAPDDAQERRPSVGASPKATARSGQADAPKGERAGSTESGAFVQRSFKTREAEPVGEPGSSGSDGTGGGEPSEAAASKPEPEVAAAPGRKAEPAPEAERGAGPQVGAASEAGSGVEPAPNPASDSKPEPEPELAPAPEPASEPDRKPKRWGLRIAVGAACLVVAVALVSAGFAAGSRWLRYNDEHDIEGTWYIDGTDVAIAFDDGMIVLDSNTSYAYAVDPQAKTISYSLGGLEGQGRYWFSADRGTLVITDGADYTMWSTLLDDLAYDASRLFGNDELPAGEGSIVLTHAITLSDKKDSDQSAGSGDSSAGPTGQGDGQNGEGDGEQADGRPAGKDDFSELSISDVLMKEEANEDANEDEGESEQEETW